MKIRRLQRWISEQLFGRRLVFSAGAALVLNFGVSNVNAQSWVSSTSSNWATPANWDTMLAPVSGNTAALVFNGSTDYTTTNDIGAFTLNSITVGNTSATTIDGGTGLTFAGTTPAITIGTGSGASTILGPITYSAATAIANNSGSLLTLSGAQAFNANLTFSGSGAKTITGNVTYTAARTITNSGGLLTLTSAHTPGANLTIAGAGNTSITGKTTLTAARTIANNGTGLLTLGDVDMGTFALTAGLIGNTTVNGNLTESAPGASLTSRGNGSTTGGVLTLAGTIGYTGSTNINFGSTLAYTNAAANPSMGALNFGSGLGYLATSAGQGALTFSSITAGNGAFGIIGSTAASKILVGGTPVTNDLIAGNLYYGGSNVDGRSFAVIDTTTKEVRAMNYATDNGAVISSGTAIPAGNAGQNIDLKAGLSSQQTISIKSLLADNSVASSLTLASGATLTIASGGLAASNLSTGTFTITGGTALTTGSSTPLYVRTQNTNGNIVINTPITGTGGLSISGQSTTGLTLGAANTFSGDTRIVNSVTTGLSLNNVLALQNSTLDLNADDTGTIAFSAASTSTAPYILGGLKGSRPLALGSAFISIGNNNQSTTYSGVLSGTNGFTKSGSGALTLSGTNTFTGNVALAGGTLVVGATATLGATGNTVNVSNGTTIRLNANLTTSTQTHIFSLAANATATFDTGTFTASLLGNHLVGTTGTLNKTGTGTLTLGSSGTATIGTINVNQGIFRVSSNRTGSVGAINVNPTGQFQIIDDGNPGTFNIAAGKFLTLNGTGPSGATSGAFALVDQSPTVTTASGPFTNWTNAVILASDSSFGVYNGTAANRFSTLSLNGAVTGPGNLIKSGNGNLILSAAGNTYGGTTSTTTIQNGGLQISGGNDRLPVATAMILGDATANTSGVFDVNGLSQTITGLTTAGTGTANRVISTNATTTGTVNVNLATGNQTYAGFLGGTVTLGGTPVPGDNLNFAKSGVGNLTLTAANTYTGTTTVSAGTLTIGNAAALPATTGAVTVLSGAVLDLSAVAGGYNIGVGRVLTAGRTTAAANDIVGSIAIDGTFNAGGTGTAATATISGNAGFNSATLQFDLNNITSSGNDLVAVGGNLSLIGTNTFAINKLNGPLSNGNYTLFSYAGALTGDASNLTVTGAIGGRQTAAIVNPLLTPGSLQLAITGSAANLTWVGNAGSNVWDLETTANFAGAANNDNHFYNGDAVTFNASGVGGATPVLVTGALSPATLTVAGTQNYTFSDGGSGSINGNGPITLNGTGTVTLGVPVTTTGTTTVNSGTLTVTTGGSIAGPVTVAGGNVNAAVDNAFTGSVAINGGTFFALNPTGSAINSASVPVSGTGVLQIGNGGTEGNVNAAITLASGGTLAFNRSDAINLSNAITGSGNIANNGPGDVSLSTAFTSGSYNFTGTGKTILTGNLSGATTITQSGSGITKLAPSSLTNTQTGAINITGGTLEVGVLGTTGNAAAVVTINGGTYHATAGQSNAQQFNIGANGGTIQVDPGFTFVKGTNGINGVGNTLTITGGGSVGLQGSGSSNISNVIVQNGIYNHTSARYAAANTTPYTVTVQPGGTLFNFDTTSFTGTAYFPFGNTTGVAGSTLTLNGDGYAGGGGVDSTTMFGAYLHALGEASTTATNSATSNIIVPVVLAGTSRFTLAVGSNGTRATTDRIVDSLIGGVSGPGGLIVDGDGNGTLAITTVAATYGGTTRVANGTLRIGLNNALPTGTTLTLGGTTGDNVPDSSGTFELNGSSQTVAGLATLGNGSANRIGNAPNTDGTLIVNYNGASPQTFSGTIGYTDQNNAAFRNLTLTKNGTGTLILSGTNDYTRPTNVNAGTLVIATAASLPSNTAAVNVASGAVLDVSAVAGGYSFIAGRTLTIGRTTTPANDLVGSASIDGILNIGGTNTAAVATVSGDLTLNTATLNFDLSNSILTGNDRMSIGGNLNANGVNTIFVNQTGGILGQGNYTLFNYSGTLNGNSSNFALSGVASLGTRATYQIDTTTTAGSVLLSVSGAPANLTWVGNAGNNVWDLTGIANFTGAPGAVPDNRFYNGDFVSFNGTGVGDLVPVTVNGALSPATIVVSGNQSYTLNGSGSITTATLTKDGVGALNLNVPVTTTSSTTLNSGSVTIGTGGSIAGPVSVTGGTLNVAVSSTLAGGLTVSGGTVTLPLANTIGAVNLTGGTTQVGATDALGATGSVNLSGTAMLQATASQELNRNIIVGAGTSSVDVTGTNTFQWNGSTEGLTTTTLTKTGTGTLAITGLNGANGGFTGTLDIQAGTTVLSGRPGAPGDGNLNTTSVLVRNGAKFQFGAFPLLTSDNPDFPESTFISVESGGTVDWHVGENFGGVHLQGGTLNLLNGNVTLSGTNNWTSGTITGVSNAGVPAFAVGGTTLTTTPTNTIAIQKTTAGTVTITDANLTISGIINIAEGTLSTNSDITNITNPLNLGGVTTNGTLQLRQNSTATFAKPVTLNAGGGTLDIQNPAGKITWSAVVSGAGNLTKSGLGALNLTGTNTYTGTTTVTAGKLLFNGNNIASTGNVNVNESAAIGGSGTIGGLTTLANTAIVAPGNSAGNLTFANGINLSAGGVYQWELGALSTTGTPGQNFDLITVSGGSLTLGGTSALTLDFGLIAATGPNSADTFWNTAQSWKIIDVTGTATNVGSASLSTITNSTYSRGTFSTNVGINADAGDIFLVFTPVVAGGSTWQGANNDNWTAATSWSGVVPNSATAEAKFVSTGGTTANLDADQTVNKLSFDSTVDHAISGPGKLTVTGTTPSISTAATNTGSQTVATNLDLAAGTTIAVNGGTLNLNAPTNATLGSGVTATVATGATLTIGGTGNALSNGTTIHANVTNDGTLAVTTAGKRLGNINSTTGATGTTTVNTTGASLTASSIRQNSLAIGAGNTVTVAPNGSNSGVSVLNSLSLTGGITPTGTLDLKDNDLIVKNTDLMTAAATHALINAQVKNASNGFAWDQAGITSSTVQADLGAGTPTALGILLNNDGQGGNLFYGDGNGLPQFSGQTVNENAVLVKYTWLGDSDLNGVVNIDDFTYFQLGYGGGAPYTGWAFGDYDYNGVVDVDDFTYFQLGFGGQSGPALSAVPTASPGLGVSAVPEPGTWAVLIGLVGATALRARRWSKKKETLL